jgi:hypothetical protein
VGLGSWERIGGENLRGRFILFYLRNWEVVFVSRGWFFGHGRAREGFQEGG